MLRGASCGNTQPAFYTQLFHPRPCVRADKATVTDCHEKVQKSPKTGKKRRQCRKWNTQKIFAFGKGLQMTYIDLHSTYIKKVQKSPKNWENVGRCTSYPYFTHARKKVKIFFYIERYGNDLHRPTSFLFSSPGGKKLLPHETETSLPLDFFGGLVV